MSPNKKLHKMPECDNYLRHTEAINLQNEF